MVDVLRRRFRSFGGRAFHHCEMENTDRGQTRANVWSTEKNRSAQKQRPREDLDWTTGEIHSSPFFRRPRRRACYYLCRDTRLFTQLHDNKRKMVQGAGALGKAHKSAGGARSKSIRAKKNATAKGKRKINRTTNHATLHSTADLDTTRDINRKNEVMVAAKAVSVGTF
jgi:hypothetical protein